MVFIKVIVKHSKITAIHKSTLTLDEMPGFLSLFLHYLPCYTRYPLCTNHSHHALRYAYLAYPTPVVKYSPHITLLHPTPCATPTYRTLPPA